MRRHGRGRPREWLVTNGLGGYAMGTVAGSLSRSYHGLLIAAMAPPGRRASPPAARTLLLAKLDETVDYDGQRYLALHSNRRADEPNAADPWITPKGFRHLERFHLEGTHAGLDASPSPTRGWRSGCGCSTAPTRPTSSTPCCRGSQPLTLRLQAAGHLPRSPRQRGLARAIRRTGRANRTTACG